MTLTPGQHVQRKMRHYHISAAVLVFLALMVAGFGMWQSRRSSADRQLAARAERLSSDILFYYERSGSLPADLAQTSTKTDTHGITYHKIDAERYQLCMTFQTRRADSSLYEKEPAYLALNNHDAGWQCFTVRPMRSGTLMEGMPVPAVPPR